MMAELVEGTGFEVVGVVSNGIYNEIVVRTINTVDAADTLKVTLTKFGIKATGLIGVVGFKHTTDNSVSVQEQPTTAVAAGVLTLTVPAGTDDDSRFYLIKGFKDTASGSSL